LVWEEEEKFDVPGGPAFAEQMSGLCKKPRDILASVKQPQHGLRRGWWRADNALGPVFDHPVLTNRAFRCQ
jgi:hypothetical protein